MDIWNEMSQRLLDGYAIEREEALEVLKSSDDEVLSVLHAAFAVRLKHFGRGVSLHVIRNAQSGLCSEDCAYCSQSSKATSPIERYAMQSVEELVAGARQAREMNAVRYCIVTSGRAPTDQDIDTICEAVHAIKREAPLQICTSLGLLTPEHASRLKAAGVNRFNHNLETSERHYEAICHTHRYADRVATAKLVKDTGLELCSGGLLGMGETLEDRVELAFALRDVGADSMPINFLDPRPGTPLEGLNRISAYDGLRALAMFRFVNPDREIRVAGGREKCFGTLQPLALFPANSMFTNGYLTTGGQGFEADLAMIQQAGFYVTDLSDG